MPINSDIQAISEAVENGESLTPEEYEVLAESSPAEIVDAVGTDAADALDDAYDVYVAELIANSD